MVYSYVYIANVYPLFSLSDLPELYKNKINSVKQVTSKVIPPQASASMLALPLVLASVVALENVGRRGD